MADIELDYDQIMQNALRLVVRDVLTITADLEETPGDHHFYIEFLTNAAGVSIPNHLKETYPERMTIVLHHQFENLDVSDDGFGVTLWFKGIEARLEVPYDAITSFADPSAKFGLRFQEDDDDAHIEISSDMDDAPPMADAPKGTAPMDTASGGDSLVDNNAQDAPTKLKQPSPKKKSKKHADKNSEDSAATDKESSADIVSLDAFRKK